MFNALGRWIKALSYLLTGQIDAARRTLDTNPHVIRAKYDAIVKDKIDRIQQYKQAVAGLIAQQENKLSTAKSLTEDVEKLERLKAGALAKAKQRVAKLQAGGTAKEAVQQDEDYTKCLGAYNDFSSTLAEKQARIDEIEGDVGSYKTRIAEHKVQLQQLARDLDKIKAEAADTVADVITAKQEKDLADTIAGIADDGTAKELQDMRKLRQEIKAEARVSKELAGTDSKAQEAEFLDYARTSTASNEFDALVGLADAAETAPTTEAPMETEPGPGLPE